MFSPRLPHLALAALALAACSPGQAQISVPGTAQLTWPGVTVYTAPGGQSVDIPAGHLPPPGSCKHWFPDRPAGQQPPPTSCGAPVPPGAVLIQG